MKIGAINTDKQVLIIAEIGNNHEGNYALAEEMIVRTAEAGADAVKFQTFKSELYVSSKDEARFNRLKSFELAFDQFAKLKKVADDNGILFLSTPFDLESAHFLDNIVSGFKIASGDNTFYPLLEKVALTGKPIIMSGGLADIEQLDYSSCFIRHIWREHEIEQKLAVLHCITSYPVEPQNANLAAIGTIAAKLGCVVGYSDHTMGIDAAVLAVAAGARIIEKHFTIDHNYSSFRDHQLSANPAELKELVSCIRKAEILMGTGVKTPSQSERDNELLVRRSIVAKHSLDAGVQISPEDITWVRPAGGLPPGQEAAILGRRLASSVKGGEWITREMVL